MMPYNTAKTMMSTCPTGLPLAQKMREVTPMSEAARVRKLTLSQMQNAMTMSATEQIQRASSALVK